MSRRERGRFSTHTASETLQRQLTAPAHKWRKAWVAPSGLQPESSYKVCKWVRVNDKDVDEETNGNEGEDDDDEGDHDDDEENEDDKEDGEEGEADGKPTTTSTPAAAETVPVTPAPQAEGSGAAAVETAPPTETVQAPSVPLPTAETPAIVTPIPIEPTPPAVSANAPVDPASTVDVPEATSSMPSAPAHEHTAIPSNAIEMSNTAPDHAEDGAGNLGAGTSIELSKPEHSPVPPETPVVAAPVEVGSLGQNEDKMDVDEPEVEKGQAPVEDAGLVMGEMKPPADQEELSVADQDQAKETEGATGQ